MLLSTWGLFLNILRSQPPNSQSHYQRKDPISGMHINNKIIMTLAQYMEKDYFFQSDPEMMYLAKLLICLPPFLCVHPEIQLVRYVLNSSDIKTQLMRKRPNIFLENLLTEVQFAFCPRQFIKTSTRCMEGLFCPNQQPHFHASTPMSCFAWII